MGVMKKVGSFAAREATYLLHGREIAFGFSTMMRQWHAGKRIVCPACLIGGLHYVPIEIDGQLYEYNCCSKCDHFQAFNIDGDQATQEKLAGLAQRKMDALADGVYERRRKGYRLISRILFSASFSSFIAAVVCFFAISDQSAAFIYLSFLAIFLLVHALLTSYRYSQFQTKQFFVPGAFKRWLKEGQWLV